MFKKSTNSKLTEINPQEITTIIGEGFTFTGDISGNSSIRVEGKIVGNVQVDSGIILGEKGIIEGDIQTNSAIIYGSVYGNVKALQVEIKKKGRITGDITTDALQIELGANYNGKLSMLPSQDQIIPQQEPQNELLEQAS